MVNADISLIYYVETNLICILLLVYMYIARLRSGSNDTSTRLYNVILVEILLYCLMDIASAVFNGQTFSGARYILLAVNSFYIAWPVLMIRSWGKFVKVRLYRWDYREEKAYHIFTYIAMAFFLAAISTPLTKFCFTLDDANLYHRGPGAYIMPVVSWIYLAVITVKAGMIYRSNDTMAARETSKIIVLFSLPPVLCSLLQVVFNGSTIAQVGITVSLTVVYALNQRNQISRDELTGLNNRREYERYISGVSRSGEEIMLCMIDVDDFKYINDTFGHFEGDRALKSVAQVLGSVCDKAGTNVFLARYGGDEFVMAAKNCPKGFEQKLFDLIYTELDRENKRMGKGYNLALSMGAARNMLASSSDLKELILSADDAMYKNKQTRKRHDWY